MDFDDLNFDVFNFPELKDDLDNAVYPEFTDIELTSGPAGPMGPPGAEGPAGPIGPAGPAGVQGPAGLQGPAGVRGPDGLQGDKGPVGDKGPTGDKGPDGEKGLDGDQGPAGEIGLQGPVGDKGPTGDKGPDGEKGLDGDQGPVGDKGPIGDQGPDGISATVTGSGTGEVLTDYELPENSLWMLYIGRDSTNYGAVYFIAVRYSIFLTALYKGDYVSASASGRLLTITHDSTYSSIFALQRVY